MEDRAQQRNRGPGPEGLRWGGSPARSPRLVLNQQSLLPCRTGVSWVPSSLFVKKKCSLSQPELERTRRENPFPAPKLLVSLLTVYRFFRTPAKFQPRLFGNTQSQSRGLVLGGRPSTCLGEPAPSPRPGQATHTLSRSAPAGLCGGPWPPHCPANHCVKVLGFL